MKNEVFGFNQAKAVEAGLDLTDLLLLNYITLSINNPRMEQILIKDTDNEAVYVWLKHEKLMEDLPILNIIEGTLRNRLYKLRKGGFITSRTVADKNKPGTKTYYALTEFSLTLLRR